MTEVEDCGLLWPSPLGIAATSPQGIQQHSTHRARENGCDYYSTIFPGINSFDITIFFLEVTIGDSRLYNFQLARSFTTMGHHTDHVLYLVL